MTKIGEELQQLNEKVTELTQNMKKIGYLLVQLLNRFPQVEEKADASKLDVSSLEFTLKQSLTKLLEEKLSDSFQPKGIDEKISAIYETIKERPKADTSQINDFQEKILPLLEELTTRDAEVIQNIEQHMRDLRDEFKKLTSGKIKEAEETMERSTNLLEKGLALVELESLLREIKSYLEELVMGNKVIKDLDINSKL